MKKYICDICGEETHGDVEQFEKEISIYEFLGEYELENLAEIKAPIYFTLLDICFKCQKQLYRFIKSLKEE